MLWSQVPPTAQAAGAPDSSDPGLVQGLKPLPPMKSSSVSASNLPHVLQHFLSLGFLGLSQEVS